MKFVLFVTLIWSILDSGWSITDEELVRIEAGLNQIKVVMRENEELRLRLDYLEQGLTERVGRLEETCGIVDTHQTDLAQNTTIEERVAILELQMAEVQEDMTVVQDDVEVLEDEMAFIFGEQVIQDERIYDLEQETTDLDTRVEVLEANGGGGGNVTALEERVETLEGTAAQHESDIEDLESATSNLDGRVETLEGETNDLATRLTVAETQIEDLESTTSTLTGRVETLEGETSELDTRLTSAETMIEDLEASDVELDSRISDLEDQEMAIAFRAVMDTSDDDSIPSGSIVQFSTVQVNEGNGYSATTGVFTVPSGGEGYYYFATHLTTPGEQYGTFHIEVNDVSVCAMYDDNDGDTYPSNGGCNAVAFLTEGDEVYIVFGGGDSTTPVFPTTNGNGFSGFRI